MKAYYRKTIWLLIFCVIGAGLVFMTNGDRKIKASSNIPSKVVMEGGHEADLSSMVEGDVRNALILYSPDREYSVKYAENLEKALEHLKIESSTLELSRSESVSYSDYSLVVLASDQIESQLQDPITRLIDYVEKGGALFWGMVPTEAGSQFQSVYRKLGIIDYGDFEEYSSIYFDEELVPGIRRMSFSEESFLDVGLALTLEERATVYASARIGERGLPLIWNYKTGKGSVTFYNGTSMGGDFWRGMAAGCVNTLFEETMYPVINALCLFIDDFPSPQYESTSDVVKKAYNKSVKEFYRDIWWPDMQKIANRYGHKYTGLFVATYNNIVNPEEFTYEASSMEQYYGNSLLKSGHEMGAHGYNHQSLTLAGGTPKSMGYKPWASTADMTAATMELLKITEELFPGITLDSYVPPSNYLSPEGRAAVKAALPTLKTISGIYTNEGEEGQVYVQDFEVAEDGVAEFPRITSGMTAQDFERFSAISAMGLYGVFSHFIHPDDIFDEDRGKNQTWETLYESYCEMIDGIEVKYPFLRSLTISDAADALQVADYIVPHIEYGEEEIKGSCENFYGEAFFYLKTDRIPKAADGSCIIEKIDGKQGSLYYLVTVKEANFTINLEEA